MANVITTVDNLPKSRILPAKPEPAEPPVEADPTAEQIGNVVDRLAQPWKYGVHRARFCKQCGVTPTQLAKIEEAYKARLAREVTTIEAVEYTKV